MSKPFAIIAPHGEGWGPGGTGFGVFVGGHLVKRAASKALLEDTAHALNAAVAALTAQNDALLAAAIPAHARLVVEDGPLGSVEQTALSKAIAGTREVTP